ncbi:MAG: universal stress protein [Dehalococcoidia bacterium]|nr:universal stress protein [Dehalococcoidia bacterium]
MNAMYDKILVPLDGSKESECIIDHVRIIAKACGTSKVVLMRVIEPFSPGATNYIGETNVKNVQQKSMEAAEEYLSYVSESLRNHCGGVETVVVEGNTAAAILDYIAKGDVDMVAMSTHGESGFTRWAVGSVTQRVMQHSPVPLMTVLPPGRKH